MSADIKEDSMHKPEDHYIRLREEGYPFSRQLGYEEEARRGVEAILAEGRLATALKTGWRR